MFTDKVVQILDVISHPQFHGVMCIATKYRSKKQRCNQIGEISTKVQIRCKCKSLQKYSSSLYYRERSPRLYVSDAFENYCLLQM